MSITPKWAKVAMVTFFNRFKVAVIIMFEDKKDDAAGAR